MFIIRELLFPEYPLVSDEIEQTVDRLERKIKKRIPAVNRIFIEAETILTGNRKAEN